MRKLLTILATCAALPAGAGTYGPFDKLVVFGDSLSDSGNIAALQGDSFPSSVYPQGQFTNGSTWATKLGLTPSLSGGTNYAYGGARAIKNRDGIADLKKQTRQYLKSGGPGADRTLAVIWAGGNDFRDLSPAIDALGLQSFVANVATSVAESVVKLYRGGVREFVLFGLPDFGALPQYSGNPLASGQASFVTGLLNTALGGTVASLNQELAGAKVDFFDVNGIFQNVLASVPDATRQARCLDAIADCMANPTDYVFYDDIHPTDWVHEKLAEKFDRQVLNPVPLPAGAALLLTGFAGIALWGKRRKSLA